VEQQKSGSKEEYVEVQTNEQGKYENEKSMNGAVAKGWPDQLEPPALMTAQE
jgi:hypothetical protein